MGDRWYCTVDDVATEARATIRDLSESRLRKAIGRSSQWIDQRIGQFVPLTSVRTFDGNGLDRLILPPILAITTLTNDGDTITSTQYYLEPVNRHWENGPFSAVMVDPDATELSVWTRERSSVVITGRWGLYECSETTGQVVGNDTQISSSDTSLEVADVNRIPVGTILLIESEQLLVTQRDGSASLTVKRGCSGTTAATHAQNTAISRYVVPDDVSYLALQIATLMLRKGDSGFAGKVGDPATGEMFYYNEFPHSIVKDIQRNYRIVDL